MKFIKESFDRSVDRERRIAEYRLKHPKDKPLNEMGPIASMVAGAVIGNVVNKVMGEDASDFKVYQVTYRHSPDVFSSFMVRASDESEARTKAKGKVKDREIIGVKVMTPDEVEDMKRRGMSLLEDLDEDMSKEREQMLNDVAKFLKKEGKDINYFTGFMDLIGKRVYKKDIEYLQKVLNDKSVKESIEIEIDPEVKETETEEIPAAPQTPLKVTIANTLNTLIRDEWEAIEGYNDALSTLRAMNGVEDENGEPVPDCEGIVKVIEDIVNEENLHVGQLQKALELVSPNAESIKTGDEEAEKQLTDPAAETVEE